MILLGTDRDTAERIVNAIQTMMSAIGRADAKVHRLNSPDAEARAISWRLAQGVYYLSVNLAEARSARGRRTSWVLERLNELEHSPASVTAQLPTESSSYVRSFGGTQPDPQGYTVPGRGHFRLPGPFGLVTIAVATIHPRTRMPRGAIDIGRTLIHELVIHAWREVSYYQRAVGGVGPENLNPMSQSIHSDRPHAVGRGSHNLADYEADLIDYYYDVARDDVPREEHAEYYRAVRDGGRTIVDWQDRTLRQREANQEWLRERQRYIDAAESFIRLQSQAESRGQSR
jgi:hypothetical protein